jgi:hypothetical protein
MNCKGVQAFASLSMLTLSMLSFSFQGNLFAQGQEQGSRPGRREKGSGTPTSLTIEQKIALAMSGGPAQIVKDATIAEMAEMNGDKPKELRRGTNGWVCYAVVNQPMCLDQEWQKWAAAWMSKAAFKVEKPGIAYMLRGDNGASNTDPYATAATATNDWVVSPAHLMLLLPDPKMLDVYPTDPRHGGPWVMWKGTPYAHVMVPVSPTKAVVIQSHQPSR